MKKLFIKNRKGEHISVLIEENKNQKGLIFVMHGLGGFKEQEHIRVFADAFKEKGFTAIRFDTTNTLGESGGEYENATITNYYQDLEDVVGWAQGQKWYQEPFALSGHSLGGICTALYAENYPEKVFALVPISPVVSGKLSIEAHKHRNAEDFANWEKVGWKEEESRSKPGVIKRLPWSHVADKLKYDLLPNVANLTMPVLLITGENDTATPPDHVRILFEALPGPKEFHVIKNAPHTFRDEQHLEEIKNILLSWIDRFAQNVKKLPPSISSLSPKTQHRSSRVIKSIVLAAVLAGVAVAAIFGLRRAQESFFEEVLVEASFEPMASVSGGVVLKKSLIGSLAPDFTLENEAGKSISLRDFRGRSVVLLFFARWNEVSLEVLRTLQNTEARLSQNGVVALAIGNLESKDAMQSLKDRGGFALPMYADPGGVTGEAYGLRTLPAFFFVDKKGMLTREHVGLLSTDDLLVYALEE